MRYLHPVAMNERFVASGVYQYTPGVAPDPATDEWTIHEKPDGTYFIRFDSDRRATDGSSCLSEILFNPLHGLVERFDAVTYLAAGARRQTIVIFEDYLQVTCAIDNQPRQYMEFPMPASLIVIPSGNLIVLGYLARVLAAQNGTPHEVVLGIDELCKEKLIVESMRALHLEEDKIMVSGKQIQAHKFRLDGADGSRLIWLDAHDTLLRLESAEGSICTLIQYARRPDPQLKNP